MPFDDAFAAAAAADPSSSPGAESCLSAFAFGLELYDHLGPNGSTANDRGPAGARHPNIDIDREDRNAAARDAARLAASVARRYGLDDELQVYFSGAEGFHLHVPAGLFGAAASRSTPAAFRRLAGNLAGPHGVAVGVGVDDTVRLSRAPNSRHPETDLHKIPIDIDTLFQIRPERLLRLATTPRPVAVAAPAAVGPHPVAVADYREAAAGLLPPHPRTGGLGPAGDGARLFPRTGDFIRGGAGQGERNRRLLEAAKNFADFAGPAGLIGDLLREPSVREGVRPVDVRAAAEAAAAAGAGTKTGETPLDAGTRAFPLRDFLRGERDERLRAAAADLVGYRSVGDLGFAAPGPPALVAGLPEREVRAALRRVFAGDA